MTTIFCDKTRMIADKQTTGTHVVRRASSGSNITARYPVKTKDSVKIHTPPNLWYKGKKVMALGFSGTLQFINPMVELFCKKPKVVGGETIGEEKPDIRFYTETLSHFPQIKQHSMSCLGLCEDGTMFRMTVTPYSGDFTGPPIKVVECTDPINVVGSGKRFYEISKKFEVKPPDTMDAFLHTVHQDPQSSYDYSSYTLKDKKFVIVGIPSKEEIDAAIDRYTACCDFKKEGKEGFLSMETESI